MPDTGQPRGDGAIQDWLESDVVYYIGPLVTIYRYQFQHCPQLIPWTLARALEIAKPNSSHTGLFQLPCGLTQAGGDNHIVPRGLRTDRGAPPTPAPRDPGLFHRSPRPGSSADGRMDPRINYTLVGLFVLRSNSLGSVSGGH